MPFEFIQIPANRQRSAKEELNKLLRSGRIASVRKEFVANGGDSFWAFCIEFLNGVLGLKRRATDATPLGLRNARDEIPKVAASRRNLGLRDAIPLGLAAKHGSSATEHEPGESAFVAKRDIRIPNTRVAPMQQSQRDWVAKPRVGQRHEGLPGDRVSPRKTNNPIGVASGMAIESEAPEPVISLEKEMEPQMDVNVRRLSMSWIDSTAHLLDESWIYHRPLKN